MDVRLTRSDLLPGILNMCHTVVELLLDCMGEDSSGGGTLD